MKTLKLFLAQTALVCAVGAFGEVRVDTKLPAGCVIAKGIEGDTVRLEHDFRTTQGGWFYWAFRVTGAEGMMRAAMADDELGRWCRENVEFRVVPFVDLDGVVDGDQGKNRTPWDHARDYNEAKPQEHPEVAAIIKMLKTWKPTYVQDTHAPWLRGSWKQKDNTNEYVYQVGNAENGAQIAAFGAILERLRELCEKKFGIGARAEMKIV